MWHVNVVETTDLTLRSENLMVPIERSPYLEAQQDGAWQVLPHHSVHWVSVLCSRVDTSYSSISRPLKAFIHDRKPRNIVRKVHKVLPPTVKEELHSSSEEDDTTLNDQSSVGNSQELSSQASSAEPHTPSPQYSAARVHAATFESTIDSGTPDPARQAGNVESENSHLANLLSNLQRSAALSLDDVQKPQLETVPTHPVAPPPEPLSLAPQKPAVHGDRLSQARSPPVPSRPQSHERVPPAQPSFATMSSATSPSLRPAPAGATHGRKGSAATADISPYLASTRNVTKEMRYISILENVARESDRAASRMGHRPAAILAPQAFPPLPPPSVPPPVSSLDQSVIYSSPPALTPHMHRPTAQHPMYHTQTPNAFLGRPRTSHAYHSPQFASGVPRQSMNEHQLRAILPLVPPQPSPFSDSLQAPVSPIRTIPPQFPSHIGELSAEFSLHLSDVLSIQLIIMPSGQLTTLNYYLSLTLRTPYSGREPSHNSTGP